jgi:hypothetical protein
MTEEHIKLNAGTATTLLVFPKPYVDGETLLQELVVILHQMALTPASSVINQIKNN